jgi:hypothetical protein
VDENKNYVMEIVRYIAGPYKWTILPRSVSPGKYYLKISHPALALEDISDAPFSIVAAGVSQSSQLNQMANILESARQVLNQMFDFLKGR